MQGGGQGGSEQGSLWQQSDLLDLVAAASPQNAPSPQSPVSPPGPARHQRPDRAEISPRAISAPDATDTGDSVSAAHAGDAVGAAETSVVAETALVPELAVAAETSLAAETAVAAEASPLPLQVGAVSAATADAVTTSAKPEWLVTANAITDQGNGPASANGPAGATQAAPGAVALPACPQRLLILDTETTALSPQQGQCIELGAVLFDVSSRAVLMQVSFLMPCDHNPAQAVNGIPAAVSRLEQPWRSGLACFEAMVAGADALLAHNAAFDRQWFGHGDLPVLEKPWICSMEDIRWPAERHLRATPSVRDLALAYGVPVWAAHRALTDCIYLVQVFQRCEQLESLLQAALEPRRLVRARLSYDERQLAKEAGFRWNEPVPKAWSRRLSEREIAALPFPVDPVEAEDGARQRRQAPEPLWRRSA